MLMGALALQRPSEQVHLDHDAAGQEALDHNDTMLAHEEAELQDQLHELPFDNVEVER